MENHAADSRSAKGWSKIQRIECCTVDRHPLPIHSMKGQLSNETLHQQVWPPLNESSEWLFAAFCGLRYIITLLSHSCVVGLMET